MTMNLSAAIPPQTSQTLGDLVILAGLTLYVFELFVPGVTALGRIGLSVAFMGSLFGGRWRVCLPFLRHPIMLALYAFIAWMALSALWSLDAGLSLLSVRNVFKDYLLVIPPFFYLLSTGQGRHRLFRMLALVCVVIMGINTAQYVQEYLKDPGLLTQFKLHRGWSHPLLFLLPFVILQAWQEKGYWRLFWSGVLTLSFMMLLGTGARAAWLGVAAIGVIWALHAGALLSRRQRMVWLGSLLAVLSLLVLVSYTTVPFVRYKLEQGFDTSGRIGGPWTAATDMIADRPVLGYGFSKEVYNLEFKRRVNQEITWVDKRAIGPHSNYLEVAHAGGLIGLGLLLVLYGLVLVSGWRNLVRYPHCSLARFGLAGLAAFVGFYGVRAGFESVRWGPLIIPLMIVVYCAQAGSASRLDGQDGSGRRI